MPRERDRYLANLGTPRPPLARRRGRPRAMATCAARDLIAAAIELNPDAPSGREAYQ
ncbi:MAG: hypothetical protein R3B68_03460 [Phycisphaerales bacterium]